MSHFLEIVSILIISVTKESVYGSTHALVGNYSELNPKDCGITRFTPNLDYSCFKWHKNIVEVMKGRNATEDEVPWIIQLVVRRSSDNAVIQKCTGSFIADHWVLTAAHCLVSDDPKMYEIYPGIHSFFGLKWTFAFTANRVIKHWDYESTGVGSFEDIGLIRLKTPFNSIEVINASLHLKSICLPQKNIFNAKQEFALFGGWGQVDRYQWPLQIGINLIYPPDDYSAVISTSSFWSSRMDNDTFICKGDSGGPVWQYYNRHAVIIGILVAISSFDNNTKCEAQTNVTLNSILRVSKYIDWIKSVTQLN